MSKIWNASEDSETLEKIDDRITKAEVDLQITLSEVCLRRRGHKWKNLRKCRWKWIRKLTVCSGKSKISAVASR